MKIIVIIIVTLFFYACKISYEIGCSDTKIYYSHNQKQIVLKKGNCILVAHRKDKLVDNKTKVFRYNTITLINLNSNNTKRLDIPIRNDKISDIFITDSGSNIILICEEDSINSINLLNTESSKFKSYSFEDLSQSKFSKSIQIRRSTSNFILPACGGFGWGYSLKIINDSTYSLVVPNFKNVLKDTTYTYKFE